MWRNDETIGCKLEKVSFNRFCSFSIVAKLVVNHYDHIKNFLSTKIMDYLEFPEVLNILNITLRFFFFMYLSTFDSIWDPLPIKGYLSMVHSIGDTTLDFYHENWSKYWDLLTTWDKKPSSFFKRFDEVSKDTKNLGLFVFQMPLVNLFIKTAIKVMDKHKTNFLSYPQHQQWRCTDFSYICEMYQPFWWISFSIQPLLYVRAELDKNQRTKCVYMWAHIRVKLSY